MEQLVLSNQQTAALCRDLALLLHAGISLADGLFLLAREEQGNIKDLLKQLGHRMDEGCILSDALAETKAFPNYVIGMIRIGERTGRMEESLTSLADYFEERQRTNTLLRSAVAYPGMILCLMLTVVGVLLIKVLPVFDKVYASLGSRLTGAAAGLLHLGQFLKGLMPWLLGLLAGLALLVLALSKVPQLRQACKESLQAALGDRWIARKFNNARFARAMAMGLGSGLNLEEALELARMLLTDVPGAEKRCVYCTRKLGEGASLAEAMDAADLLSGIQARMLSLGIQGGTADQVMETIADQLSEEAENALDAAISRVEPAMVLISSLLVGLILLTVMLPLMNVLSSLG